MNERAAFIAQATITLDAFVREHPEYTIDAEQPEYRGGTNYVTLGHCGAQPVIFKAFIRSYRWAHELFCLRHFAPTGYVPQVLAVVPEQLIVMMRWPDSNDAATLSLAQRELISYQIGQAIAALTQQPLPSAQERPASHSEFEEFAWRDDVEAIVQHCLVQCRRIQQTLPSYQTDFYTQSLTFVEAQIPTIAQQPRLLFHEDLPNFCVYQGQFQGFYDLEMMRVGTEALQLGVAVDLIQPHWLNEEWLVWPRFLEGYQAHSGRRLGDQEFPAILAMNHFYYHIRICRWGKWDGDPIQTGHTEFATKMAEPYHRAMKRACESLRGWVDVDQWFAALA